MPTSSCRQIRVGRDIEQSRGVEAKEDKVVLLAVGRMVMELLVGMVW